MKQFLLFIAFSIVIGINSFAQLTITTGQTAQQLAELLAGPNIVVTNAVLTGSANASAKFNGTSNLGFNSGVLLSTGNVNNAKGPNNVANSGNDLGTPGTPQMTAIAGIATEDAITLEFDFQVQSSLIQFNYIFASEEYPEYAPPISTGYNDVFAFFISGPGISGEENMALVPNLAIPVSINNINAVTNSAYYIDNAGGATIQYDGFTTQLTARKSGLIACQTYHLKLVICDAGDGQFDSAVFLQENSLVQGLVDVQTQTATTDLVALEGCVKGSFTFSLNEPSTTDRVINFTIAGSAVNGVDYAFLTNSLTIPSGEISGTVFIEAYADGLAEGQESIDIIYQASACSATDTAHLFIQDAEPIDFTLSNVNLDCFGDNSGEILVTATGGFPPYTYIYSQTPGDTTHTTSNPITGLNSGEYTIEVTDIYGCKAQPQIVGGEFNAGQTFLPDGSGVTYTAPLSITGFDAGQVITDVSQIQQICLTMEHSYLGDLEIRIQSPTGQSVVLKQQNGGTSCDLGEPIATAPVDGNSGNTAPGVGYEYCFNADPVYGTMVTESGNFTRT